MRFAFFMLSIVGGLVGCAAEPAESPFPDHWPGEDLAPCARERAAYRIDTVELGSDSDDAEDLGWDFDYDGTPDNQGGALLTLIDSLLEADLAARANDALLNDSLHVGLGVERCPDDGSAFVELYRGTELDRLREPPRMRAEAATSLAMVALAVPGAAAHGSSQFPVGTLLHESESAWIDAPRFVVVIDEIDDDAVRGRLVAAFDIEQVFDTVTRAFTAIMADWIADHPECPADEACADSDLGVTMSIFDENEDWVLTEEEVRANHLMITLVRADVPGDGPIWETLPDDEEGLYSIGVGFTASRVQLVIER